MRNTWTPPPQGAANPAWALQSQRPASAVNTPWPHEYQHQAPTTSNRSTWPQNDCPVSWSTPDCPAAQQSQRPASSISSAWIPESQPRAASNRSTWSPEEATVSSTWSRESVDPPAATQSQRTASAVNVAWSADIRATSAVNVDGDLGDLSTPLHHLHLSSQQQNYKDNSQLYLRSGSSQYNSHYRDGYPHTSAASPQLDRHHSDALHTLPSHSNLQPSTTAISRHPSASPQPNGCCQGDGYSSASYSGVSESSGASPASTSSQLQDNNQDSGTGGYSMEAPVLQQHSSGKRHHSKARMKGRSRGDGRSRGSLESRDRHSGQVVLNSQNITHSTQTADMSHGPTNTQLIDGMLGGSDTGANALPEHEVTEAGQSRLVTAQLGIPPPGIPPGAELLEELERFPWSEHEVLTVLREGRPKPLSSRISVAMMHHLHWLLHRPLVRLAREACRLAVAPAPGAGQRVGRHEVMAALRVVLSRSMADSCVQAICKASALFSLSGDSLTKSKSSRAGLRFSIGKFHRWLLDTFTTAGVSTPLGVVVTEGGAMAITAATENLLEEIVLRSLGGKDGGPSVFSIEDLEAGIGSCSDLWGVLQPYKHILAGRTADGNLSVPSVLSLPDKSPPPPALEQCLLATSPGSIAELDALVTSCLPHVVSPATPAVTSGGAGRWYPMSWAPDALHMLYYYMKEEAGTGRKADDKAQSLYPTPPLCEWVRVASAHAASRRCWVVDVDDVRQAARLLLPGHSCPPRISSSGPSPSLALSLDAPKAAVKLQTDVAFHLLLGGRVDLCLEAIVMLGKDKVNTQTEAGLSPLMFASIRGDTAMATILLDNGADVNQHVPAASSLHPCVHPESRWWTPLCFAAAAGHEGTAGLLLERGANVEGHHDPLDDDSERRSETPLQLASARGDLPLVTLLLDAGANAFLSSLPRHHGAGGGAGCSVYNRAGHSAVTLAASHGHRSVLRTLVTSSTPSSQSDVLSLEEILAEGQNNGRSKIEQDIYEDTKNMYMTIADVVTEETTLPSGVHDLSDSSGVSSSGSAGSVAAATERFTKGQFRVLQEALYHAAENGFVDIVLELRDMGVPWTLHSWGCCVEAAYVRRHDADPRDPGMMHALLDDFALCRRDNDSVVSGDFVSYTLPLLVDMLIAYKNEPTSLKIGSILQSLYGSDPIPPIPQLRYQPPAKIDPRFVNNPELSDVQFLIEGQIFYAHRIILVNASNRFRAMLSPAFSEGAKKAIELNDVTYKIFEYLMQYLYHGGRSSLTVAPGDVLDVLAAAHFFMLDGLQRHCEVLAATALSPANVSRVYRHAKLYNAHELVTYCEAWVLHHLPSLLAATDRADGESLRKMLFSSKRAHYDLVGGLLATLSHKLTERIEARTHRPVILPANGGFNTHVNSVRL